MGWCFPERTRKASLSRGCTRLISFHRVEGRTTVTSHGWLHRLRPWSGNQARAVWVLRQVWKKQVLGKERGNCLLGWRWSREDSGFGVKQIISTIAHNSPICFSSLYSRVQRSFHWLHLQRLSHPAPLDSLFQPRGLCILYHCTALALTVPSAWKGLYPDTCVSFSLASFRCYSGLTFPQKPSLGSSSKIVLLVCHYLLSLFYFSLW